ncbi:MAG: type 1 glutamine amidotransferase [Alphaproteobacteria bacterium]|nr:type 1 glutamine amidotransferase [Alphaproteobacteria bacterium]
MHIGILQTGHMAEAVRAETGDYPDMFARLLAPHGLTFTTWDVEAMQFPAGPEDAEGWLITGSRHGAYEDHAWIPPLEALVREIVAARRPLVGICFGHQIVAQALGGTVEKARGGWSVGRHAYRFESGETLGLNAWHQDQVTAPPEGARTIAWSDDCPHAGFAVGDRVLTYQAHPEFGDAEIAGLIAHRAGAVAPDRVAAARATLGQPTDRETLGARIAAFLRAGRREQCDVA